MKSRNKKEGIAIIGMSCRFPGANNPQEFWDLISTGQSKFSSIPSDRQEKFDFSSIKTLRGSFLENPFDFGNTHFKISDSEATSMDPQQRIMLELALQAKENALLSDFTDRNVGVFIGANQRSYLDGIISKSYRKQLLDKIKKLDAFNKVPAKLKEGLLAELLTLTKDDFYDSTTLTGNISNIISGRISHEFNLKGPSLTIDTACSSSLVAIHTACESIYNNECNLAFAGGINLNLTPTVFSLMEKSGAISLTGNCIPFSEKSDGILLGEGGGLILLKRYENAIKDGNPILGLIKGSGMNNDGRTLGIMAPSWRGQLSLLESVYNKSNFDRNKIGLIEAHGTSTRIGDSVEMTVIERFFDKKKTPLSIGSVKSNIGHTMGASGIAGLIKVVMAIQAKKLPPSLYGEKINPKWKLKEKGFSIQEKLEDWQSKNLLAAGVSSFGFGGTNAHIIIEEPDSASLKPIKSPIYTQLKQKKFEFNLFPKNEIKSESLFSIAWEAHDFKEIDSSFRPDIWLLFCDKNQLHLRDQILKTNINCVTIYHGDAFTRLDEATFTINFENKSHLKWMFEGLNNNKSFGIIYSPLQNDEENVANTMKELTFVKHLFNVGIELVNQCRAWCISYNSHKINNSESLSPHEHSITTLFSSALNENIKLQGGIINLKANNKEDFSLIPKLITQKQTSPFVIRNKKYYTPILHTINTDNFVYEKFKFHNEGVYLIIGGSSGVGEEIAKHINNRFTANIIISGTRDQNNLSKQLSSCIGDNFNYIQTSVEDKVELKNLIDEVFKIYGQLNGVIFSAGAFKIGTLKTISDLEFQRILAIKLIGIRNLYEIIKAYQVDFVYLLSSASSLSPSWSYGIAAYGASNAYLNAFAEKFSSEKTIWLSRSWSIWQNIGMSKNMDTSSFESMKAFNISEALELFDFSVKLNHPHLAVLQKQDAESFSPNWSTLQPKPKTPVIKPIDQKWSTSEKRPDDFTSFLKQLIADAAELEISEINEEESFTNMGLDSISALDIVSRLEKQYNISLNPTLLFEYDSIKRLSEFFMQYNSSKTDAFSVPLTQRNLSISDKSTKDFSSFLKQLIAEAAELEISEINEEESFTNMGIDSISALDIVSRLEKQYNISLNPTLLFEYDSIERLSQYFNELNLGKTDQFPLLSTQKTFYSNQIFYPDLPCNCMVKMSFEKQFDIEILQKAWDLVIKQHQSMNLVFEMKENGPVQRIADFPINLIEVFSVEAKEVFNDFIKTLENKMVNKVYEFNHSALYDLCYVEIEKSTSVLLFNAHHIITDAWSMNVMLSDLLKNYKDFNSGHLKYTPKSSNPFFSYVNYINNKKKDDKNEVSSTFWKMELKEFKPFNLPNKKIPSCLNGHESYSFNEVLDADTLLKVESIAKSENITLFQMLISCYFKTIQGFSGHNDLVIRLATDNRDRSFNNIQMVTGCIADSLPLRIQITKNDNIMSICDQVKSKLIEVGNYNTLSSIDYANIYNSRSEGGPMGITPFGMSYLNIDYFNKINEIELPLIEARSALPFTDLSLICFKQNNSLHISWNYSSASFSSKSIEEISKAYLNILLNEGSKNQLKNIYKEVAPLVMPENIIFSKHSLLHNKVFAACDIFNKKIAINDNGRTISYSSLKAKSIQLANGLINSKNNQAEAIGILEYPGANAVLGILGILASDCAYIPLDPDWPTKRIEGIISLSDIDVLITSTTHFEVIAKNKSILKQLKTIVLLDDLDINISKYKSVSFLSYSQESEKKLSHSSKNISPKSLAYVMYTSGTTGVPKGVMVNHSAVEIFLSWISEEFGISKRDKFIATSSLGFGGSIRQIFSTLLAGGEIYPIDRFDFKDPKSLLHFLEENRITILNTVPSVLQNICDFVNLNDSLEATYQLPNLRLILVGGEILQGQTIAKWKNNFGPIHKIFNLYGSTETIVNATFHEVGNEKIIPIGKARKGSHVLLLNERGCLCEPDEKGELYVGGPSLASGYYKDDIISKQKFINLKIDGAHGVYYRTGDLAKLDNNIYRYLGRNDNQIQLYGNRIEPAEIESLLVSHEGIKNAAVLDFKNIDKHFLLAFIELTKNTDNYSEIEIRNIVADKLPQYMVPQKIEFLEKLPFNHAGKIDRKQLRELFNSKELQNHIGTANTSTQSIVKNIWEKTLKIGNIDPDYDFFMIGGDSISALEVLHHLRMEFKIAPKPVELFRKRTINQLSACLDDLNEESYHRVNHNKSSFNGQMTVNNQQFPLSYSQKGFLFLNKLNPNSSPNLVALVPIKGELNTNVFQNSFNYLVLRHPLLRTRFITEGLKSFQKITPIKKIDIGLTDITEKSEDEQKEIVKQIFEAFKELKFNLSKPPLFQIEIIKHSKLSYTLILGIHHIIGDAWSLKILTDELLKVYDEKLNGNSGNLPELKTSFFDFIMLESKMNNTSPERMQYLEGFWRETFKGLPEKGMINYDISSEKDKNQITLKFTTLQKENLKLQCLKNGISLFQLIFASYARALQKTLKINYILINSATSGREMQINKIDQIIGCFARNIPVKITLTEDNLLNNIKVVEKAFLNSLDHQDISPNNQIKILLENGSGNIQALHQFIISFMDFTALPEYNSSKIILDWDKADFFFNTGSVESDLMLGIRVLDEISISFNGRTNTSFKNEVKKMMNDDLIGFMEFSGQETEIQPSKENENKIDSALIAYFPAIETLSELLPFAKKNKTLAREFINKLLPKGEPKLLEIEETIYGRSGIIFLPLPADELFVLKQEELLDLILNAIKVAEGHGATHISLAGNLSSKTNYCYSVIKKINSVQLQNKDMVITTGHSCTVVAVIKTIEKVLTELDLNIGDLIVGVAGFGSIGQASLNLLLNKIGRPAKIIIADLASQIPSLKENFKDLQNTYPNAIEIIAVEGIMPKEFYSANLIIGSSSQGQILDVEEILPGTILADDSFPHIIDTQKAIKRMKNEKDVLIIGAGKINLGKKNRELIGWPISENILKKILYKVGDEGLPGCLVESVMMSFNKTLPATIGLVTTSNSIKYWNQLTDLKINAVKFHLQGFEVDNNLIQNLKNIQNKWKD